MGQRRGRVKVVPVSLQYILADLVAWSAIR
jgi:hypothetical protein